MKGDNDNLILLNEKRRKINDKITHNAIISTFNQYKTSDEIVPAVPTRSSRNKYYSTSINFSYEADQIGSEVKEVIGNFFSAERSRF
jgi:hypothetical protein